MGGAIQAVTSVGTGALDIIAAGKKREAATHDLDADIADASGGIKAANRAEVDAIERGRFEAGVVRMKGSQLLSQQRVAAATSGADTQSGTPGEVAANTRAMSALDARQVENNAMREAWGHREEANTLGRRRTQLNKKRNDIEDSGLLEGLGIMLGSMGKTASAAGGAM